MTFVFVPIVYLLFPFRLGRLLGGHKVFPN